jgi:hypothetical protein
MRRESRSHSPGAFQDLEMLGNSSNPSKAIAAREKNAAGDLRKGYKAMISTRKHAGVTRSHAEALLSTPKGSRELETTTNGNITTTGSHPEPQPTTKDKCRVDQAKPWAERIHHSLKR